MRHLLNTLFVLSEDVYLTLDGENVIARRNKEILARYPLHTLSGILCFSYAGASPALMGACAKRGISLSFCTPRGRFLARITGENNGNVLLRRIQYRWADDQEKSCQIAKTMIFGKLYNSRQSILRTRRDHSVRIDSEKFMDVADSIKQLFEAVLNAGSLDRLRGLEGAGSKLYFSVLDDMILNNREIFSFKERNRRPPLDPVNAMLSFSYSLLAYDCAAALESVGLDAYVGFFHRDRPGRSSLSLDLMEELRPCMADRFVLTLINNRILDESDFLKKESGAVLLTDKGRRVFLDQWQKKKKETLKHPFTGEKIPWGLIPYLQALLLARFLRGDLDGYPPFLWR